MPLIAAAGEVSFSRIQQVFGGVAPISASEYFRDGVTGYVPTYAAFNRGITTEATGANLGIGTFRGGRKQGVFNNANFTNRTLTAHPNGVAGSLVFPGWEFHNVQVVLFDATAANRTLIGGFRAPRDLTVPARCPGDAAAPEEGGVKSVAFVPDRAGVANGAIRLRLAAGTKVANKYQVLRGPYIITADYQEIVVGDIVSFWWRGVAGGDAYDVFCYLLQDDGTTIILLNQTGTDDKGGTEWAQVSRTILNGEQGNYKFVFVCGTYDFTGGRGVGGILEVDNLQITF